MTTRGNAGFRKLHRNALDPSGAVTPGVQKPQARLCGSVSGAIMSANALIDTGAILALLDGTDRWHRLCVDSFQHLTLPLLTSEGVLTELFHLVGDNRKEMESTWKFVRSGAVELAPVTHSELPQIHALMSRYWDRPMDFADATLVHLAKRESLTTILTVDFADFETYRIEGRRRFRVLPVKRL
jgi:predicted nucleic acid-binding protein